MTKLMQPRQTLLDSARNEARSLSNKLKYDFFDRLEDGSLQIAASEERTVFQELTKIGRESPNLTTHRFWPAVGLSSLVKRYSQPTSPRFTTSSNRLSSTCPPATRKAWPSSSQARRFPVTQWAPSPCVRPACRATRAHPVQIEGRRRPERPLHRRLGTSQRQMALRVGAHFRRGLLTKARNTLIIVTLATGPYAARSKGAWSDP
jgi:hypothetical protein